MIIWRLSTEVDIHKGQYQWKDCLHSLLLLSVRQQLKLIR